MKDRVKQLFRRVGRLRRSRALSGVKSETPSLIQGSLEIVNRRTADEAFGLICLQGFLRPEAPSPSSLEVHVGSEKVVLDASDCFSAEANGSLRVRFHILTHLISNGETVVSAAVTWAGGRRESFPPFPMRVNNCGPLAAAVTEDIKSAGVSSILGQTIDSSLFPYNTGKPGAWLGKAHSEAVELSLDAAPDTELAHRHLDAWGFCILPERLPRAIIRGFRNELMSSIAAGHISYRRGTSERILNAHLLESGRRIWLHQPVLRFLQDHFQDAPCACQTLTFVHGSQQNAHQDTIHLTPYPPGFMCGVWIALEDVRPGAGELFVYPGSHRTRRLFARDLGLAKVSDDYSSYVKFDAEIAKLLAQGGYERRSYLPKAGQILVWHENLVHGGSVRRNRKLTRLSIVSHYFARGSIAYYDSRGEAAFLEGLPDSA